MPSDKIDSHFLESSELVKQSLATLRRPIIKAANLITRCFAGGGKLLICGNGGSAAQSQHFAAELVGRYLKERKPLPAIALTTDSSALTAIGNDYDFSKIFSRQLQALAKPGDVLVCVSTSGNSLNVLSAANQAHSLKLKTIAFSGFDGGKLKSICDINLIVPSHSVPHIQEVHLTIIHIICDLIESSL